MEDRGGAANGQQGLTASLSVLSELFSNSFLLRDWIHSRWKSEERNMFIHLLYTILRHEFKQQRTGNLWLTNSINICCGWHVTLLVYPPMYKQPSSCTTLYTNSSIQPTAITEWQYFTTSYQHHLERLQHHFPKCHSVPGAGKPSRKAAALHANYSWLVCGAAWAMSTPLGGTLSCLPLQKSLSSSIRRNNKPVMTCFGTPKQPGILISWSKMMVYLLSFPCYPLALPSSWPSPSWAVLARVGSGGAHIQPATATCRPGLSLRHLN